MGFECIRVFIIYFFLVSTSKSRVCKCDAVGLLQDLGFWACPQCPRRWIYPWEYVSNNYRDTKLDQSSQLVNKLNTETLDGVSFLNDSHVLTLLTILRLIFTWIEKFPLKYSFTKYDPQSDIAIAIKSNVTHNFEKNQSSTNRARQLKYHQTIHNTT